MRPSAQFTDVETELVDLFEGLMADETCTVTVGLPESWTPSSDPHVGIGWDFTDTRHQAVAFCTIRVTAYAGSTGEAKRLALLAHGLILADPSARPLTGPFPARDPDTRAEVASFTVRWSSRSVPIP